MSKISVLYAEDNQESRENYAFVLQECFETVYTAKDGKEALELYHEKSPDVLLLDISMPILDGLEVAKAIREKDESVPIIILTAHTEQEKLMRAVTLKLEDYLQKPINYNELIKMMNKTIGKISDDNLIIIYNNLVWNIEKKCLGYKNTPIGLTKKEKILVTLLAGKAGEYIDRDTLIYSIWYDEIPDSTHEHKLTQLIYRFNKKIGLAIDENTTLITNSHLAGYKVNLLKD